MNTKYIIPLFLFLSFFNPERLAMAYDLITLEKEVVTLSENSPETAPDYFMGQIESNPAPAIEVQAIYLYGMGLAYEKLGNMTEAVDYYRGAELFDHPGAAAALVRLDRKPFPRRQ